MKIDKEIIKYLNGEKFSNGYKFNLSKSTKERDRDSYILNSCKKKKVLHLGFLDHVPLIEKKINENRWLHSKLLEKCELCIGFDIDNNGIEFVKENFNIDNVLFYDFQNDKMPDEIKNNHFDVLLISDVIEHIGDPLTFLKDINRVFKNVVDKIIITTPNAFRLENFLSAYKNEEVVNTDHKFWFSQYTLSKLIIESGFEIKRVGMCQHLIGGYSKAFKNFIVNLFPNLKQTLVFEFVFKK